MKHPPETAQPASLAGDAGRLMKVSAGSLDTPSYTMPAVPLQRDFSHAPTRWRNSASVAERRRWLAHRAAEYLTAGDAMIAMHAAYVCALIARRCALEVTA